MAFLSEDERSRALAMLLARQGIRMPMPQPVQATQASPLPAAPVEAPIVAPQAEAAVAPQQPQFDPLAAARAAVQQAGAPTMTGVKEVDAALAARAAQQQAGASGLLNVMAQAQEDPVAVAIRQARLERIQKDRAGIEKEQKRAGWDALARAGLAMAKSNSPYFMQALASGMEAGLEGLDKAKLEADEKKSRLQAAEEDAKLAEVTGRQAAQDRAVAVYNVALSAGKSEAEARDAAIKSATTIAQLPQAMEMGNLEVRGKRAQVATDEEQLKRLRQTPLGGFGRGGGGGGGSDGDGEGGPVKPKKISATANEGARMLEKEENEAHQKLASARRAWVNAGAPASGTLAEAFKNAVPAARAATAARKDYLSRAGIPYTPNKFAEASKKEFPRKAVAPAARPAAATGGSKPKSFPGTQAEWNAMTAQEKKLFQ